MEFAFVVPRKTTWGEVPSSLSMLLGGVLSSYVAGSISRCMLGIRDTTCPITSLSFAHVCMCVGLCVGDAAFMFLCSATDAGTCVETHLLSKTHWVVIGTLNSGQEH